MAVDTPEKRAAAASVGPPTKGPSLVPDGTIGTMDRASIAWSYAPGAGAGTVTFYGTVMESGVASVTYDGITFGPTGDLRTSGNIYEGA